MSKKFKGPMAAVDEKVAHSKKYKLNGQASHWGGAHDEKIKHQNSGHEFHVHHVNEDKGMVHIGPKPKGESPKGRKYAHYSGGDINPDKHYKIPLGEEGKHFTMSKEERARVGSKQREQKAKDSKVYPDTKLPDGTVISGDRRHRYRSGNRKDTGSRATHVNHNLNKSEYAELTDVLIKAQMGELDLGTFVTSIDVSNYSLRGRLREDLAKALDDAGYFDVELIEDYTDEGIEKSEDDNEEDDLEKAYRGLDNGLKPGHKKALALMHRDKGLTTYPGHNHEGVHEDLVRHGYAVKKPTAGGWESRLLPTEKGTIAHMGPSERAPRPHGKSKTEEQKPKKEDGKISKSEELARLMKSMKELSELIKKLRE